MRPILIESAVVVAVLSTAAAALASPPMANELMLPFAGKVTTIATPDEKGGSVPSVARGQALGVACADVGKTGADVRVVMQVTRAPTEPSAGYDAVLATDQKIGHGAVHIRVPDLPELADHTVTVKVFVMDSQGTHTCDAGRVRIS